MTLKSNVEIQTDSKQVLVIISNEVTSETHFPSFSLQPDQQLVIHFQGVQYINSGGVRNWISWISELAVAWPQAKIALLYLPSIFVRYASQIRNFLPQCRDIKSFIVPYHCAKCNHSTELAIEKADLQSSIQGSSEAMNEISTTTCPSCGGTAEIDAVPEHYLGLL